MDGRELLKAMQSLTEQEIIELAKEMELPVKKTDGVFDKERTIKHLINGGCEGCGKSKKK